MARYPFYTADVFTATLFGGNPLAVLPDAHGLTAAQMQGIAREFNLSETVFVLPPVDPGHTRQLRIFTPRTEVPFAGHPTLGAAYVLAITATVALTGERTAWVFDEGVGPVPVTVQARAGKPDRVYLTAAHAPVVGPPPPDRATLADILALAAVDLETADWHPAAVSCGMPFLLVPVRDRAALRRVTLNRAAWNGGLRAFWAPHL